MSTRKIAFPDHTADDFDPDQVFEADNELKYTWNGYGWELVDGGIKGYDDTALWEDQKRQDDEFEQDQKRQDAEIEAIKDEINYCKVNGNFYAFPLGIMHSDYDVQFTGAGAYFTTAWSFEVGDELTITTTAGEVDIYLINNVGDIEQEEPNGNEIVKPKRLYSFTTAVAHNYMMMGQVHIASCEYPWVTPEEFAEGQAAQDDAFVKGQAVQDKALQDEIDARANRDLQHDAQIETIEYKLDALLGLQFRGTYRFDIDVDCETKLMECYAAAAGDINAQQQCNKDHVACEQGKVQAGEFEALDPDGQFDKLLAIVVHLTDLSGIETEWGNVLDQGDYLEIDHQIGGTADKTNYGLYRIKAEPEISQNASGENVYSFELEFLQGDGEMLQGEIYEIRGINKDEGVNPEELADFLTKDEAMNTYLPLIGGELTGTLKMSDANVIQTRHLDSGQNTDLTIKRNGERRVLIGNDKVVFDKAPEYGGSISAENQLVNKKYVDNNSSSGEKGAKGARGYTGDKGKAGGTGATGSVKMKTGTSTSPTLSRGEMYWNYNNYTIYVGK